MSTNKKYDEYLGELESESDVSNEYYDLMRQNKFSELKDKEIQLENSKAQASKQTMNSLNAQGLGSTGYGSSSYASIYNNYMNGFNELQRDYQNSIDDINLEQRQNRDNIQEEDFQQLVNLIEFGENYQNKDRLNGLLQSYGLGTIGEDGTFTFNEKPDSMSNLQWSQLQYLYGLQTDEFDNNQSQNFETYGSLDDLKNATYFVNGNKAVGNIGNSFNRETDVLWNYATKGTFSNGDTIKLTNKGGNSIYLQWTSSGFKFVDQNEYDNSENQFTISATKKNTYFDQVKK